MNPLRRRLLLASAALLASPRSPHAQAVARKVGVLIPIGRDDLKPYREALVRQLAAGGFAEGRNLELDVRSASQSFHEDREVARELVRKKIDALFTLGTPVTESARAATKSVPIVFAWVADPVASGILKSLADPGGNVTGVSNRYGELAVKRLELARELRPAAKRVAFVHVFRDALYEDAIAPHVVPAAKALGVELIVVDRGAACCGWDAMFGGAARLGAEVVVPIITYATTPISGAQLVERSNVARVPVIFSDALAVERGGLISYGTNLFDELRRGADVLVRVLKGTRPGDIPVDQAARFELVVNLKTAKAIGIAIPPSILLRADRVIE